LLCSLLLTARTGMSEMRHDTPSTWRHRLWSAATFLLLLPLLAMQVTGEVRWGAADFALFALMLATACGAVELAFRALPSRTGRIFRLRHDRSGVCDPVGGARGRPRRLKPPQLP